MAAAAAVALSPSQRLIAFFKFFSPAETTSVKLSQLNKTKAQLIFDLEQKAFIANEPLDFERLKKTQKREQIFFLSLKSQQRSRKAGASLEGSRSRLNIGRRCRSSNQPRLRNFYRNDFRLDFDLSVRERKAAPRINRT